MERFFNEVLTMVIFHLALFQFCKTESFPCTNHFIVCHRIIVPYLPDLFQCILKRLSVPSTRFSAFYYHQIFYFSPKELELVSRNICLYVCVLCFYITMFFMESIHIIRGEINYCFFVFVFFPHFDIFECLEIEPYPCTGV
jgi:hypothetical protein